MSNDDVPLSDEELTNFFRSTQPEHLAYEQLLADEKGVAGTIGDVGKGLLHGATDAIDETIQFAASIPDFAVESLGGDLIDDSFYRQELLSSFVPRPVTATGKFVEDIAQFGFGMLGASKFRKAAQLMKPSLKKAAKGGLNAKGHTLKNVAALKGGKVVKALDTKGASNIKKWGLGAFDSATASLIVQDPYQDTLAEIMQKTPALANWGAEVLANKVDDTEAERRLNNVLEDMGLSATLGVAGMGIKALMKVLRGTPVDADGLISEELRGAADNALLEKQHATDLDTWVGTHADTTAGGRIQAVMSASQMRQPLNEFLRSMGNSSQSREELLNIARVVDPVSYNLLKKADYIKNVSKIEGKGKPHLTLKQPEIEAAHDKIYASIAERLDNNVNGLIAKGEMDEAFQYLKGIDGRIDKSLPDNVGEVLVDAANATKTVDAKVMKEVDVDEKAWNDFETCMMGEK